MFVFCKFLSSFAEIRTSVTQNFFVNSVSALEQKEAHLKTRRIMRNETHQDSIKSVR